MARCRSREGRKETAMKTVKWLMVAMLALCVVAGCEKSDEEKLEDAAEEAQKDVSKAMEGLKLPDNK
jgi:Tfp pilus assembly protein PilP